MLNTNPSNGGLLDQVLLEVEEEIARDLDREPRKLFDAAFYMISKGGKRLRPRLLVAFALMFSGERERMVNAAASVEMLHNFTLIHDDIMDRDELRHGVPTTHVEYGEPMAILAGDLLQAESGREMALAAVGMPSKRAVTLMNRHSAVTTEIARGQAMDMAFEGLDYSEVGIRDYYNMIALKTAVLFQHSCWVGAYLAGARALEAQKAARFGWNLGMAFQMADDMLGIKGDPKVTGKPSGSDVRNGKKTMPILLAIRGAGKGRARLLALLRQRDPQAIPLLEEFGGIQRTMSVMERFKSRAEAELSSFHESPEKQELLSLLERSVFREK